MKKATYSGGLSVVLLFFLTTVLSAQRISHTPLQQLIPSEKLPSEITTQNSNNNLDILKFKDRYYVGFRTGPTHFASKKVEMYIMSTTDFEAWQFEKKISLGSDVREPRFYATADTLFFMFFKGGKRKFKFEPQGIFRTQLVDGTWADLEEIKELPLGFVPWRIKRHKGIFYLSTYEGINEYKFKEACELRLYTSHDGINWKAISKAPQIDHPRAIAEMAFSFDQADNLWGLARLEFDGAYIIRADKDSLDKFEYWYSPYKFDSPFMFQHQGEFYLLSRRNLSGPFVRKKQKKHKNNLVAYSFNKKTTALFKLDTAAKKLIHIQDFGTTGDCAFPGIQQVSKNEYIVLDYSSNITQRKKNWITGQLGKTYIYMTRLKFEAGTTKSTESVGEFLFVRPKGKY